MNFLNSWIKEFKGHDQNKTNIILHLIFTPLLTFSVLGLLWSIPTPEFFQLIPYLNWATLACLIGLIFWLALDLKIALLMMIQMAGMVWVINVIDKAPNSPLLVISVFMLAISWGFEMMGAIIEGRHITFKRNILDMLVAPIWFLKTKVKI